MSLAPTFLLRQIFQVRTPSPVTLLLARHWGLLIFLVGALLVISAYDPSIREPVLIVAALEKTIFAGLIFMNSANTMSLAKILALADTFFAILYVLYLLGY